MSLIIEYKCKIAYEALFTENMSKSTTDKICRAEGRCNNIIYDGYKYMISRLLHLVLRRILVNQMKIPKRHDFFSIE